MLTVYPNTRSEEETLRRVLAGASLARYGDGEFKHCADQANVSQAYHPRLSARLREILVESGSCMVGIPNLHSATPKQAHWEKYAYATQWLAPRPYASAFITRPDSAPWINTPAYWAELQRLWVGHDVTLVRGEDRDDGTSKCLTRDDLIGSGHITEILCPRQHAFSVYDSILERIGRPKRALVCLGPSATVLCVDLCARGVHAIDLGHSALFLRKWRRGEPMSLSKEEKSMDKAVRA